MPAKMGFQTLKSLTSYIIKNLKHGIFFDEFYFHVENVFVHKILDLMEHNHSLQNLTTSVFKMLVL